MAKSKHTASGPTSPAPETNPVADAPKPPDEAGGAGSGHPAIPPTPAPPKPTTLAEELGLLALEEQATVAAIFESRVIVDLMTVADLGERRGLPLLRDRALEIAAEAEARAALPPETPAPPPTVDAPPPPDEKPGSGLMVGDSKQPKAAPAAPAAEARQPEPARLTEEQRARVEAEDIVRTFLRASPEERAANVADFAAGFERMAAEVDDRMNVDPRFAGPARVFFTIIADGFRTAVPAIAASCAAILAKIDAATGGSQSFRVTATSRYVVPGGGGITELREGSVVSAVTHDLASIRAQGVPLEACETPRLKHGPLAEIDRGLVPSPMFQFTMAELPEYPEGYGQRDEDVIRRESGKR